jgi:Xaa-Pro aminopeptidase
LKVILQQQQDKSITLPELPYSSRIQYLQHELKHSGLDAYLIERPLDIFYFTGLKFSAGKLLVGAKDCTLLVDSRYLQMAKEKSPCPCFLDSAEQLDSFCQSHDIKQLGFDGQHTSYDHFLRLGQLQKKGDQKVALVPATAVLKSIRSIKDEGEISKMKASAALLWKGFEQISSALKKGVTEKELSKAFELFCLESGADGLSFEPIIAFGPNSAMPHYRSQDVPLKEGDVVLIDIGIVFESYHSDMTRVLFFKTEDPYLSSLYSIVKRAQRSALESCRPGKTLKQIDLAARKVFKEEGVEELFLHSLGHGIGLETHEYPKLRFDGEDRDVVLKSGMVFTVEPGLYMPGKGGIRYEDTIVITSTGYENFYPA